MMNYQKYRPYPPMDMPNRKWPNNTIKKAPIWCSVDMRDGNQALEIPMNLEEKLLEALVEMITAKTKFSSFY